MKSLDPAVTAMLVIDRALPGALSVTPCGELEEPRPWLAKVRVLVESEAVGGAAVPVKVTVCGLVLALSVMVRMPFSVPDEPDGGVKVTLIVQLALALMLTPQLLAGVSEKLLDPTVNAMLVKFSVAVPESVTITVCGALEVPGFWAAKVRVVAESVTAGAATVPLKLTVCVPALSVMVTVPVSVPDDPDGGVKVTLIVQAAPAPMAVPQVLAGVREKSLAPADNAMLVKVRVAVPVSVTVTF